MSEFPLKPVEWIGSSYRDLCDLPEKIQKIFGFAICLAQDGQRYVNTKPMKGFGGAGILEVVADGVGGTYRAVYTIRFARAIYVLHVFQKKSRSGVTTPKEENELLRRRLSIAAKHYQEKYQ